MRKQRVWIILAYCLFVATVFAWAQTRKAGLWQIATTTKILQPGEPPGSFVEHGNSSESSAAVDGGLPVCLTQEMIDKYGVILPPSLKDCELSHVTQTGNSFMADMTCKGSYNGMGSVESTWTDEDHVVGKVRFVAKTSGETNARSITWTQKSTAVFKGPDCGAVKPRKMPAK